MKEVLNMMRIILWAVIFIACNEELGVNVQSNERDVVVTGHISTDTIAYRVNVNRTADFTRSATYEPVTQAEVFVTDELGNQYVYQETSQLGIYESNPNEFVGRTGGIYQLHVETRDGLDIISQTEVLNVVPKLDSIIIEEISSDNTLVQDPKRNRYIVGLINDEANKSNYYRWRIYINGQLRSEPEELILFDDQFTDGNRFRFDASNVLFEAQDLVEIEHISLSKDTYDYFVRLKNLTERSESTVSQAFPLNGNLIDLSSGETVLGQFWTSDVQFLVAQDVP